MMKRSFVVTFALLLASCASTLPPLKTVCMKEDVPVMYVPAPPVIDRPDLPIDTITPTTSAGDIAKMYVASVKALEDYTSQLEAIVADYKSKHDQSQVIADQVKGDEKQ